MAPSRSQRSRYHCRASSSDVHGIPSARRRETVRSLTSKAFAIAFKVGWFMIQTPGADSPSRGPLKSERVPPSCVSLAEGPNLTEAVPKAAATPRARSVIAAIPRLLASAEILTPLVDVIGLKLGLHFLEGHSGLTDRPGKRSGRRILSGATRGNQEGGNRSALLASTGAT
jgi:hypothetical protein